MGVGLGWDGGGMADQGRATERLSNDEGSQ